MSYSEIPVPLSRRLVMDATAISMRQATVYGLFEVDVTVARQLIRDHRAATGEAFSFTSFIVSCLARAVARHPIVQGYLYRGRVVVFDDVDAVVIAEVAAGEFTFPLAHVVRDAGNRSIREIHDEIRRHQKDGFRDADHRWTPIRAFLWLPAPVRRIAYALMLRNPHRRKKYMGTVSVTALGMYGDGEFWGIALPQHTLQLVVGGIAEKPAMEDGRVVAREFLSLTLAVNHDVVDGGPATRFANDLKQLIETADGLADAVQRSAQEGPTTGSDEGRNG
jgi:pyruvate/2-oxoglutarate dehydrogenase complex dihydrolipoamide acyltransferase (E2) component